MWPSADPRLYILKAALNEKVGAFWLFQAPGTVLILGFFFLAPVSWCRLHFGMANSTSFAESLHLMVPDLLSFYAFDGWTEHGFWFILHGSLCSFCAAWSLYRFAIWALPCSNTGVGGVQTLGWLDHQIQAARQARASRMPQSDTLLRPTGYLRCWFEPLINITVEA